MATSLKEEPSMAQKSNRAFWAWEEEPSISNVSQLREADTSHKGYLDHERGKGKRVGELKGVRVDEGGLGS